jgi:hypothetical protein
MMVGARAAVTTDVGVSRPEDRGLGPDAGGDDGADDRAGAIPAITSRMLDAIQT